MFRNKLIYIEYRIYFLSSKHYTFALLNTFADSKVQNRLVFTKLIINYLLFYPYKKFEGEHNHPL